MQQQAVNIDKETTVEGVVTAYKYLLTNTGVIFVISTDSLPEPPKNLNIAKAGGSAFLQCGKIYALLTDTIIGHLKKVMSKANKVSISFACSLPGDYEIKTKFSVIFDVMECATLISLYKIAR